MPCYTPFLPGAESAAVPDFQLPGTHYDTILTGTGDSRTGEQSGSHYYAK